MSQVYTTRRRAAPNGAEPAAPSSKTQQPEVNQGSLSLDGGGMGSRLDELMQEKMRQHFLDNQIPEAEREADRLASAAQGARTPEEVKARMGQRLGADFSGVRFHADSGALRTAEDMGGRAYATGRDIYFGQGGFDPAVAAHELVHTVQQGQVESSAPTVSAPAGQVQMLPKRLKAFGHSVAQAAKTVGGGIARVAKAAGNGIAQGARTVGSGLAHALKIVGHSFAKFGTGIGEFVGGKAGLLKPSEEQRDQALAKAQQGDYSQFAILRKADAQAMVDAKKAEFLANGMPDPKQLSTTEMLNPVTRKAMSQIAGDEKLQLPAAQRQQFREAGEVMDQRMIVNTMKKVSDGQAQRMVQHYQNMDDQKRLAQEYARSKYGKTYLGGEGDGTLLGAVAAR